MVDTDGWRGEEFYELVAREQRSEQLLWTSDYGGDFDIKRFSNGSLVVANSWMIAVRIDARKWLKFNLNGDTRADARLGEALCWVASNPRFFIDGRIYAAVGLIEIGDPRGKTLAAQLMSSPDLGQEQRDLLTKGRASHHWHSY